MGGEGGGGSVTTGYVHINAPAALGHWRGYFHCPICKKRRRYVAKGYAWYEPTQTCLGCGDSWQGAELSPRPFARGWRPKAIAAAKRQWDETEPGGFKRHLEAVHQDVEEHRRVLAEVEAQDE